MIFTMDSCGATSVSTPSMASMLRASSVYSGGNDRFCLRRISSTSVNSWPTLISLRFAPMYCESSCASFSNRAPWSTSELWRVAPSSASIIRKGSFSTAARMAWVMSVCCEEVSVPTMPRSIQTILPSRTTILPAWGSAWKNPLSTTWVT